MKQVIFIEGGIIQEIISEIKNEIVVIDRDVEGLDKTDIRIIEGDESYIYRGLTESKVDPERVKRIYEEADKEVSEENNKQASSYIAQPLELYLRRCGIELSLEKLNTLYKDFDEWLEYWLYMDMYEAVDNHRQS
jgi:hypothetical protein